VAIERKIAEMALRKGFRVMLAGRSEHGDADEGKPAMGLRSGVGGNRE